MAPRACWRSGGGRLAIITKIEYTITPVVITMNRIIKVSLLFKNPSAVELVQLGNVIWIGKSLEQQEIFLQQPSGHEFLTRSRLRNLDIIRQLQKEVIFSREKPS